MNPYTAEFLGTFLLILLGNGVVAGVVLKGSKSENAGWLTIVAGWGISVTLAIYAAGKFSGAHLNPAITIALAVQGGFSWADVPGYILAQFGGAFAGAVLVWLHYGPHWKITENPDSKRAVFCTAPAIRSTFYNVISEVIGTCALVLVILLIGQNEFAQGLNPVAVGMLIMAIGLGLGGTTGFAINPARDLGPRIAHFVLPIPGKGSSDWGYAWIPVVGPVIGGLLAVFLFGLL
ncbi:MAG: aquaporin family protein [Cyclobacteriaceae bacterium]|nr:aquaporin family protein [Cyclobacteriaceae bacterium]